ncbi:MAG: STAS domain-containing protein, partial [Deltaproteobacteria bacterium]|nr:STAS domain-containing protein [Deltaproteobacteria bacterium]
AYQQASVGGTKNLVLCFDKDGYINSGGIAILIGIAAESREKGQCIRLTGLSPHFQKIFDMMGLTKYMQIFPSEETALEGF